ncbi:MAG: helix-turn-helix transcriptional regulator [Roseibium sp.]
METFSNRLLEYLETGEFGSLTTAFCEQRKELSAFLAFSMRDLTTPDFLGSQRVDPALVNVMRSNYLTPDSNPVIAALPYAVPGRLLHKTELVRPEHFDNQGVYENFVRPSDTDHFGTALYKGRSGLFMFTIGHRAAYDWMSEGLAKQSSLMLGEIVRAVDLKLNMEVGSSPYQCELLVDEDKVIRCFNSRHKGVVDHWFSNFEGKLRMRLKKDEWQLDHALERALSGQPNILSLSDEDGAGMSVECMRGPCFPFRRTVRMVFSSLKRKTWDIESLGLAFGLTQAESAVTLDLLVGLDVREIAALQNLKHSTVRTYLKKVYSKTGKHGQAQLVSHLLN